MGVERGYTVCRHAGVYSRGPMAVGTKWEVRVPVACPRGGSAVALFHTHPGGALRPSRQDLRAARAAAVPFVCVKARGRVRCYRASP